MLRKIRDLSHSITVQIILVILLLVLPVVFLSGVINQQFMRAGMAQVQRSHTQLLESYMAQIDREMDLAANYMNSLTFRNSTTVYLTDRSSPQFYYSATALNSEISKTALYYQYISGFYLWVSDTDFCYTYLRDAGLRADQDALNAWLGDSLIPRLRQDADWQYAELNGSRYLLQGFQSGGISGGSFLCLDRLPDMEREAAGTVVFCLTEDLEAIRQGLPRGSVLLSAASEKSGLTVYEVLGESETLASLPFLQRYLSVITVFMVLTLPLVYLALRRLIIQPLRRLTGAMQKLESGDLDYQLEGQEPVRQFQQIDATFNHMTTQIKGLKIAVYEEQLENEKTRLQNLSYQLRPHFMVNSLNMAYNMILSEDYRPAMKLMRFAASYMRYVLSLEDDFVPLQQELKHMENYIGIQSLRYEDQFRYEVSVDPFVEDISIPSMILQNFIENSIKYSIGPGRLTLIALTISYAEEDEIPYACITVRDNGAGYPDWLLQALTSRNLDALRDRIGLRNTLQRIQMLYGDRGHCAFFNDGGAVTQFRFPLDT